MSWQVEGVRFSTVWEVGEEVIFLTVLLWTNFPLYCCVSFASGPVIRVLGRKLVSVSVHQEWSRAWRACAGLPAETSGVTGSGSSSVPSPRRDSYLWLIFHLLGRSNPRAGTAFSLASAGRAELEVPSSSAWRRSSPPTTACLGNFILLPSGLRTGNEKSQEVLEEWK